jgi:hypothetical protein
MTELPTKSQTEQDVRSTLAAWGERDGAALAAAIQVYSPRHIRWIMGSFAGLPDGPTHDQAASLYPMPFPSPSSLDSTGSIGASEILAAACAERGVELPPWLWRPTGTSRSWPEAPPERSDHADAESGSPPPRRPPRPCSRLDHHPTRSQPLCEAVLAGQDGSNNVLPPRQTCSRTCFSRSVQVRVSTCEVSAREGTP